MAFIPPLLAGIGSAIGGAGAAAGGAAAVAGTAAAAAGPIAGGLSAGSFLTGLSTLAGIAGTVASIAGPKPPKPPGTPVAPNFAAGLGSSNKSLAALSPGLAAGGTNTGVGASPNSGGKTLLGS